MRLKADLMPGLDSGIGPRRWIGRCRWAFLDATEGIFPDFVHLIRLSRFLPHNLHAEYEEYVVRRESKILVGSNLVSENCISAPIKHIC
jgi:hypothetical protein